MYVFTNVTNIYTHETIIEKRVYKCEHEWLHLCKSLSAVYTLIMNTLASIVIEITAVILYCVRNMS